MKKNCALVKRTRLILVIFLLSSAFGHIVIAEEKVDNSNIGNLGTLDYYPESYHFGNKLEDEADSTTFEIWRAGGCCALEYTLSWDCSWVDVFPTSGTSHGEPDIITVDIDTTGLELGLHTCEILIESNGGNGKFIVIVKIVEDTEPTLVYYPELYDFGNKLKGETDRTTFEIWSNGYGALSYSLIGGCSWVDLFPTSGTSYGEHDIITVDINTTGLALGINTCEILIESNGGNGVFTAQVNIIENTEPILRYYPDSHNFGNKSEGEIDITTFEIWNSGDGTLSYSLIWDCNWVNISPLTGSSDGEHDTITAFINTTGLSIGYHSCNISISSNGGNGIFTVMTNITERDTTPPSVSISKPKNAIYINDKEIKPFFVPLIIGPIQIWPYAVDNDSGLARLELYINDDLKETFTSVPKSWTWDETVFGRRTIKLIAYDNAENSASDQINVWRFF